MFDNFLRSVVLLYLDYRIVWEYHYLDYANDFWRQKYAIDFPHREVDIGSAKKAYYFYKQCEFEYYYNYGRIRPGMMNIAWSN